MPGDLRLGIAASQSFFKRKRHRDAGHEQKQRKDEVVELEPVPLGMFELPGEPHKPAPAGELGRRLGDPLAADDPEHVEAAKGVEAEEAIVAEGRSGWHNEYL